MAFYLLHNYMDFIESLERLGRNYDEIFYIVQQLD